MYLYFNCKVRLNYSSNNFKTLVTSGWIPEIEDSVHICISEDISMKIYCSRESIDIVTGRDKFINNEVSGELIRMPFKFLTVRFEFENINDQLALYILNACEPINYELEEQVTRIALVIQNNIENYVNRLLTFVRCYKGQYWLKPLVFEQTKLSNNIKDFDTLVSNEHGKCCEFVVKEQSTFKLPVKGDKNTLVEDDWQALQDFVIGQSESDLTLELIANAHQLLDSGYCRSSIIEGCCALETAILRFFDIGDFSWLENKEFVERAEQNHIINKFSEISISTAIKVLFPLMFSEKEVSKEVLHSCSGAINLRNKVVHKGLKSISEKKCKTYLPNIEILCRFLLNHQLPNNYIDNSTKYNYQDGSTMIRVIINGEYAE